MYFRIIILCLLLLFSGCARVYHNFYGKPSKKGINHAPVSTELNSFTGYFKNMKFKTRLNFQSWMHTQDRIKDTLYSISASLVVYRNSNVYIDLTNFKLSKFSITCFSSIDPPKVEEIGENSNEKYLTVHSTSYDTSSISFHLGNHYIPLKCQDINVEYTLEYSDSDTVITELVNFPMTRIAGHTWSLAGWILAD